MSNLFTTDWVDPQTGRTDGSKFFATERFETGPNPRFEAMKTDRDVLAAAGRMWERSYRSKEAETRRLQTMELLYSGFHYKDPIANRTNEVTNLAFSTVETVWPTMTEVTPRPEIVPRRPGFKTSLAEQLQHFGTWIMDQDDWDLNHWKQTRAKLKYGWNVHLMTFDDDGLCIPRYWSPFNFFPDPDAVDDDSMEFFVLASPIQTRKLRWMFPHAADRIFPDGLVSPGYEALVRPYQQQYVGEDPVVGPVLHFSRDLFYEGGSAMSDALSNTSTPIVDAPAGDTVHADAETTFLLQIYVKDRQMKRVAYKGMREVESQGQLVRIPAQFMDEHEPCCESGWRVLHMTASGALLEEAELDPALGGAPIEIGRDYLHEGRFFSPGEIDHLAPINRAYNRRKNLLNRALEYESLPVMVVDRDIGTDFDSDEVEPGDVLRKTRGSSIEWLSYRGVAEHQFNLLDREKFDADTVTGVHDVSQGRRPTGIEAASALRALQQAAERRIRGKEGPSMREYRRLLKRVMVASAKKLQRPIFFKALNGQDMTISPEALMDEYDIRFARGTGQAQSRVEQEERMMLFYDKGIIDQQAILERADIPGWQDILQRMNIQRQIEAQLALQAGGKEGA